MDPVLDLLRVLEAPTHLAALAPELRCSDGALSSGAASVAVDADVAERRWLRDEGLVTMAEVAAASTCEALVRAIAALVRAGYPATFVYAFDAAWQAGERIRARFSELAGAAYLLAPDAWAWEIPRGRRGWPPHRGMAEPCFDRERPEVVNTWLALSEVTADRACMCFVPLDDDAHYPAAMARVDAPLEVARALPVAAGSALAWNANVLHWGGPCAARAEGPRVSCSFTLYRADVAARFGPSVALAELDYPARLELMAKQIVVYGNGQPDVSPHVMGWARIMCDMRTLARKAT